MQITHSGNSIAGVPWKEMQVTIFTAATRRIYGMWWRLRVLFLIVFPFEGTSWFNARSIVRMQESS
jgi:hypothetical protein